MFSFVSTNIIIYIKFQKKLEKDWKKVKLLLGISPINKSKDFPRNGSKEIIER